MYRGKLGAKTKVTGIQFTKYGFRLLDKHKKKIRNNDILKFKKLKWSIIPKKSSLKDYNYQFYNFHQPFIRTYDKEFKSLFGLINFAIQVNPRYSKYKYLIEKSILPHQPNKPNRNKNQRHQSPNNKPTNRHSSKRVDSFYPIGFNKLVFNLR